jgi:hypothetical protein
MKTKARSLRPPRRHVLSASVVAVVGALAVTLFAQSYPAYDRSDEGEIWEYVGTIGRSIDHCFSSTYPRGGGTVDPSLCPEGPEFGDLFEPTGVATFGNASDGTYRLYVADRQNRRVVVFGSETSFQGYPYGNYIDAIAGWDATGNHLTTSSGAVDTFGLLDGVAVDASGNLLVADNTNARIVVFNSSLQYLFELKLRDGAVPAYFAVTPGATIQLPYGANPGNQSDVVLQSPTNVDASPGAQCATGTPTSGRIAVGTFSPYPVSGSPDDMNVVIIYDERMCEVDRIGTGSLDGSTDFVSITGLAFERVSPGTTGFGRLYVADYGADDSPVYVYAPDAAATDYPDASAPAGRLVDTGFFVFGVAVDKEDRIVVTEPDNQRIAVFTRTWDETNGTVTFSQPADLEIRAAGQISDSPIAITEDSSGRLLATAGANGSDVVHVIEQPSLAVFDPTATILDQDNLALRRVHVEFKVATPSRQTVSRTNVIPQAGAVSSGLGAPTGPTPVPTTVNGTTYAFPTTGASDPLHIAPGDYAVYSFEFPITDNTLGTSVGATVTIDMAATSDGPVNAPKKTVTVNVPDPNCTDTIAPDLIVSIMRSDNGDPLAPVSGVVQGVTRDIYGRLATIRLSATDTGGSTQMNVRWKFTDGPRSGGVAWSQTGFVTGTSLTQDIVVVDGSVLTSANHTLSYEVLDSCAQTTTGGTTIFVDVVPPNVIFENVSPANQGTYPDTAEKWWNSTVTVDVRGTDDDTSASNVTLSSTSDAFEYLTGRTDAGRLVFPIEGVHTALVEARDLVGNASSGYSHSHGASEIGFIRIDKTVPVVTIAPTSAPNAAGWYTNDVEFAIQATDPSSLSGLKAISASLSGPATASLTAPVLIRAPAPHTRYAGSGVANLSGEGQGLQVSASAEDYATNVSAPVAAALVNIDNTRPTVSWVPDRAEVAGFYQESVVVTLTAFDTRSGVNRIEYSTDGVSYSSVAAATATLTLSSTTTLRFRAVDNADNVGGGTVDTTESAHTFKVNHKPSIVPHALTTDEDMAVSIDLLTGAVDPDSGTTLTVTDVSGTVNGSVSLSGSTATFTPETNYFGAGSFSYTVSDGNGGAATATVSVTVISVNDPPVAIDDAITILEDAAPTPIDVLANDSDVETPRADLVVMTFTQGTKGAVSAGTGQMLLYTPAANANGVDTFTYTTRDADGDTATATVTVTITPVNDAPVAADDSLTIAEDTAGTVNVLANDTDVDGDLLSVQSFTQGAHGVVSAVSGGLRYTPAANYYGPDAFTYVVSDGDGATATASVTVTVTAVPDAPTALDDTAQLGPNPSILIDVLANDFDVDNLPPAAPNAGLVIIGSVQPENGTAVPENTPSGVQIRYTPNGAFVGTDTFQYTIDDGTGLTDTATVSVLVNTPPVCTHAVASLPFIWPPNPSQTHQIFVSGVTDPNGDPITITITKIEQDEPVDSTGDGKFTPDGAGVGTSSAWLRAERRGGSNGRVYEISFRADDGRGGSCTGSVLSVVPHDMGPPPTWTDDGVRYDSTEAIVGARPGPPRSPRASANGRTVTRSWDPPLDEFMSAKDAVFGAARSYTVVVGIRPGANDLGSHDVGSTTAFHNDDAGRHLRRPRSRVSTRSSRLTSVRRDVLRGAPRAWGAGSARRE